MHDSYPERRNLTVTSLAFIIYYLADGKIEDPQLRLQVINMTFDKPEVLACFAWIILLWFALRYWLSRNHPNTLDAIRGDIQSLHSSTLLKKYANHRIKNAHSLVIQNLNYQQPHKVWYVNVNYHLTNDHTKIEQSPIPINGLLGIALFTYLWLYAAITRPSITSYLAPYLIFLLAVTTALVRTFVIPD